MAERLREALVSITLEWEQRYGVAPRITANLSEYDAAMLAGHGGIGYGQVVGSAPADGGLVVL